MLTKTFKNFDDYIKFFFSNQPNWIDYSREYSGTGDEYKKTIVELNHVCIELEDCRDVISSLDNFKQHAFWSVSEVLSEIFAMNPPLMSRYNLKVIEWAYKLRDDKSIEYMYGRRWSEWNQILNVIETLSTRLDSKRAVVNIFTPYDTDPKRNDVPCTLMYQFLIRDNQLHLTVFYRSHDINSGVRYDVILSSFMQQLICMAVNAKTALNIRPGKLIMFDGSLHKYPIKDADILQKISDETLDKLILGDRLSTSYFNIMYQYKTVKDIFDELWLIKNCEEASYQNNFQYALKLIQKIQNPAFRDFARVYFNKNLKHFKSNFEKQKYETRCLRWD